MIFLMGVSGSLIAFTDFPKERFWVVAGLVTIFGSNFMISLTPCYTNHKYEKLRVALNVFTIMSLISVVLVWYLIFASPEEIDLFLVDFLLSLSYLIIGFIFYRTRFPEAYITERTYG